MGVPVDALASLPADVRRVIQLARCSGRRTPVVLAEAVRAVMTIPRLPAAEGLTGSVGSGGPRRHLVLVGDSLAAAVGVAHQRDGLAGQLADRIAARECAQVTWEVRARTGTTAGEALAFVDAAPMDEADVVVLSVGANDTKDFHTVDRWRRELDTLLVAVRRGAPRADVVLLPVPLLAMCPGFPPALRDVLAARAVVLDSVADAVVSGHSHVLRIPRERPRGGDELFVADGVHPSPTFFSAYAEAVDAVLGAAGSPSSARDGHG